MKCDYLRTPGVHVCHNLLILMSLLNKAGLSGVTHTQGLCCEFDAARFLGHCLQNDLRGPRKMPASHIITQISFCS